MREGKQAIGGREGAAVMSPSLCYPLASRRKTSSKLGMMRRKASGYMPYFAGKPNPLIVRALRHLDEHSENAVIIGDTMFTDIRAELESDLETILVLRGVMSREMLGRFPYQPNRVVESVAEIVP